MKMNTWLKIKCRVFEIVEIAKPGDVVSKIFDIIIISLILISVVVVIESTVKVDIKTERFFQALNTFTVIVFTLEYAARIWTADLLHPDCTPGKARLKYIFSGMAIIDLLAILPFYFPYFIPMNLIVLRTLRVLRLLRVFKFNRYTDSLSTIGTVLKERGYQLISSIFVVMVLMVIASVLIYTFENPQQPEVFQNAFSGMWWAVATLTTVGYGDIYPITIAGKIFSAIIALLGIGLVAIPTGIISAGFIEQIETKHAQNEEHGEKCYCPYCGKKIK